MEGQVRDMDGKPVAGAIVDVWHANTKGGYSFFDPSASPSTTCAGASRPTPRAATASARILPSGYACPPDGPDAGSCSTALGRHGNRPAHIHFFVSAPGYRKLTTQINIDGDAYLHDDFAFATRDELIPPVEKVEDAARDPGERPERPLHRDHLRLRAARRGRAPRRRPRSHREHAPAA